MPREPVRSSEVFCNTLLTALPFDEAEAVRPLLTRVTLVGSQVLYERGNPIEDVFFPERGLVSLTADTMDSGSVEVGMTGREGLVGVSVLLHPGAVAANQATVQIAGSALRMRAAALREAAGRLPVLRDRCLRCAHVAMVHSAQSAACNARHALPERLARWLLLAHDRADGDELPLRQELLSVMLGVRRAGVNVTARTLQAGGLIRQSRGRITVLDRAGLENAACNCYRVIRDSQDATFGPDKAAKHDATCK